MKKMNRATDDHSNQLNVDEESEELPGKTENRGWFFKIPLVRRMGSMWDQSEEPDLLGADEAFTEIATDWKKKGKGDRLGVLVLLVVFVVALGYWLAGSSNDGKPKNNHISVIELKAFDPYEQGKLDADNTLAGIRTCITGYFKATTILELLPYVRLPDRVRPLMLDYYSQNPRASVKLKTIHGIRPLTIEQKPFIYVDTDIICEYEGRQETKSYQLVLEQVGDFEFRVDWEGNVFYMPMSWKDYCLKRPLKPLDLRVIVKPDDFYAYAFRDRSRYQCYKLTSHRTREHLFGYVERGTALAAEMEALWQVGDLDGSNLDGTELDVQELDGPPELEIDKNPPSADLVMSREDLQSLYELKNPLNENDDKSEERQPMILRLRFLREDASQRCVLIEELVCKHWIYQSKEDSSIILE